MKKLFVILLVIAILDARSAPSNRRGKSKDKARGNDRRSRLKSSNSGTPSLGCFFVDAQKDSCHPSLKDILRNTESCSDQQLLQAKMGTRVNYCKFDGNSWNLYKDATVEEYNGRYFVKPIIPTTTTIAPETTKSVIKQVMNADGEMEEVEYVYEYVDETVTDAKMDQDEDFNDEDDENVGSPLTKVEKIVDHIENIIDNIKEEEKKEEKEEKKKENAEKKENQKKEENIEKKEKERKDEIETENPDLMMEKEKKKEEILNEKKLSEMFDEGKLPSAVDEIKSEVLVHMDKDEVEHIQEIRKEELKELKRVEELREEEIHELEHIEELKELEKNELNMIEGLNKKLKEKTEELKHLEKEEKELEIVQYKLEEFKEEFKEAVHPRDQADQSKNQQENDGPIDLKEKKEKIEAEIKKSENMEKQVEKLETELESFLEFSDVVNNNFEIEVDQNSKTKKQDVLNSENKDKKVNSDTTSEKDTENKPEITFLDYGDGNDDEISYLDYGENDELEASGDTHNEVVNNPKNVGGVNEDPENTTEGDVLNDISSNLEDVVFISKENLASEEDENYFVAATGEMSNSVNEKEGQESFKLEPNESKLDIIEELENEKMDLEVEGKTDVRNEITDTTKIQEDNKNKNEEKIENEEERMEEEKFEEAEKMIGEI